MSGAFSIGGLMTGLDSNNIITQLMTLERQPIVRMQSRISNLQVQRDAVAGLRTQLTDLLSSLRTFRTTSVFDQFQATSSATGVLTAEVSGSTPVAGAYNLQVTQLASATAARSSGVLGNAINPGAALQSSGINGGVTAGQFTINGVAFTVDPTTDTLAGILGQINASSAGVTATYDGVTDMVTIVNTAAGDTRIINFGATGDTGNFLSAINIAQATQRTNGSGSTETTSTHNLGAVNATAALNTVSFGGGVMTSGSFQVNGITISVDVTTDSLIDVIGRINDSDAGVTASYDTATDTIRMVSDTLGSRTIGFTSGTSNFLALTNLATAVQTAGNDAQFTINGGSVLTRNTNEVSDAIGGVTLRFLSAGASTVTVSADDDGIVEDVQSFVETYNASIDRLESLLATDGTLGNDFSIRQIEDYLRTTVFNQISGLSGDFMSLADIGVSTGATFNRDAVAHIELDEDKFRQALRTDRANVQELFYNTGQTGVADQMTSYLEDATSTSGYLNERIRSNGTIDRQIQDLNDRITRKQGQVSQHERRLRAQFTRLEQLTASFQNQNSAIQSIGSGYGLVSRFLG